LFDDEEAAVLIKFYNQCMLFNLLLFILSIVFILCSHVFGTALDLSDLEGSQVPVAVDVEDKFETVRRQRSAKRACITRQRSGLLEV
jgi:hypothetical protein